MNSADGLALAVCQEAGNLIDQIAVAVPDMRPAGRARLAVLWTETVRHQEVA